MHLVFDLNLKEEVPAIAFEEPIGKKIKNGVEQSKGTFLETS